MTFNTLRRYQVEETEEECFKPCYKWMTFNTVMGDAEKDVSTLKF